LPASIWYSPRWMSAGKTGPLETEQNSAGPLRAQQK
jgi:hypothetical protein